MRASRFLGLSVGIRYPSDLFVLICHCSKGSVANPKVPELQQGATVIGWRRCAAVIAVPCCTKPFFFVFDRM